MSSGNAMAVEFNSGPRGQRHGFIAKISVVNCGEIVYLNGTESLSVPSGLDKDSGKLHSFSKIRVPARVDVQVARQASLPSLHSLFPQYSERLL